MCTASEGTLGNGNLSYRDGLTNTEKEVWDEAYTLFDEMLDDLNKKGLLRKGMIRVDRERLKKIWENSMNFGNAFNEMVPKFTNGESVSNFIKGADLTPTAATYVFLSQLVGTALINLESVFKTSLLFFMLEEQGLRKNMALGQLLSEIERISPAMGARLKNLVNTEIRNPLAHGTFWFEKGNVRLATNSYLEDFKEMPLHKFWIEIKKINIIAVALTEVLGKKVNQGYFRV